MGGLAIALLFSKQRQNLVIVEVRGSKLSETTLARFVHRARKAAGLDGLVSVLITNNAQMRRLNSSFRKKDKPTDVLSFPATKPLGQEKNKLSGDVAISWDIARHNAQKFGHSPEEEVKALILHGVLHLAGHDHEKDQGKMAQLEKQLRTKLNIPATLIERNHPGVRGKGTVMAAAKRSARPQEKQES